MPVRTLLYSVLERSFQELGKRTRVYPLLESRNTTW
jgi:hypothetical protein